jgi:hypothetical protein
MLVITSVSALTDPLFHYILLKIKNIEIGHIGHIYNHIYPFLN